VGFLWARTNQPTREDFHFRIAARRGRIDGGHNPFNVTAQNGPLLIAKQDDGNFAACQVLVELQILLFEGFVWVDDGPAALTCTPAERRLRFTTQRMVSPFP
jgi:hypothetical protein